MFRFEEPYLCIKVIFVFVGFSSILRFVLGFRWKFKIKIGKPVVSVEIAGEYRY